MEIRTKLQQMGTEDASVLATAMNEELSKLVWDDIHKRAGHPFARGRMFGDIRPDISVDGRFADSVAKRGCERASIPVLPDTGSFLLRARFLMWISQPLRKRPGSIILNRL